MIRKNSHRWLAALLATFALTCRAEQQIPSWERPTAAFDVDPATRETLAGKGIRISTILELGQSKTRVMALVALERIPQETFRTWDLLSGRLLFLSKSNIEVWTDGVERSDGWPKLYIAVFGANEDLVDLLSLAEGKVIPLRKGTYEAALERLVEGVSIENVYESIGKICPSKYFLDGNCSGSRPQRAAT